MSDRVPHAHVSPFDAERLVDDRRSILCEIEDERVRQDAKWGGVPGVQRRDDHTYAAVLGEEFGECCRAWLERDMPGLRAELIQAAAVAVAWIEELDNGGAKPRPTVTASVASDGTINVRGLATVWSRA